MALRIVRFADFELDPNAYELRQKGRVVPLQRIPLDLLFLLVERRGQLVRREEIVELIWGKKVFLEAESSINTAIRKLRRAFQDDRGSPRFIATVSTKGYRFIAELDEPATPAIAIPPSSTAVTTDNGRVAEAYDGRASGGG